MMRSGPKQAAAGPNRAAPRASRAIADSWRGLYGSDLFPSIVGVPSKLRLTIRSEPVRLAEWKLCKGVFKVLGTERSSST